MSKKRVVKIPRQVSIKCPLCGKKTRLKTSSEESPQYYLCKKCNNKIKVPNSSCCIICAYSNKKCPYSLMIEAKRYCLEVRY